jgi:parallel beta-helix repeat protein
MTLRPRSLRPRPSLIEPVESRLLFSTFVVRTTADSGPDSLRAAIIAANESPADDDIVFEIAPAGRHTINLLSPLPPINGNVTIDATTQPGYADDYRPVIELNGQSAGPGADGLHVASTDPDASSNVLGLSLTGFSGHGIVVSGDGNTIAQCYVGADVTGAAAGPGNGGHGILVSGSHNLIEGNTVAFNLGDGVAVAHAASGNTISPNVFFSNGGLAIDLGDDGPTANDPGDADDGANHRQNYPVITSITPAPAPGTGLRVTGTVNTTPRALVQVVLYTSPDGEGEGRRFFEVQPFETDAAGNGTFTATLPDATTSDWVTATATSYVFTGETSDVNTSEFSPPAVIPSSPVISAVYVRGQTWAGPDGVPTHLTFGEYLESRGLGDDAFGFRADAASEGTVLPWVNMDQIVVRYSEAPTGAGVPTAATIDVAGEKGGYVVVGVAPVAGDPAAFLITLNKPLGGGNPAQGVTPTADENGDRVTLTVRGGGPAGTDYARHINVLQGDTDHVGEDATHTVLARDYAEVKKRFFKNTNDPAAGTDADYSAFHDVDASGVILALDYAEVKKRFFHTLSPDAPAPTAGAVSRTSTAAPTSDATPPAGITGQLFSTRQVIAP